MIEGDHASFAFLSKNKEFGLLCRHDCMYLWICWHTMLGVKVEYFLCITLFDQVSGVQSDVLVQDLKILLEKGKADTLWKCCHVSTLTCVEGKNRWIGTCFEAVSIHFSHCPLSAYMSRAATTSTPTNWK